VSTGREGRKKEEDDDDDVTVHLEASLYLIELHSSKYTIKMT
jgi:hypothetical protein